MKGVKQWHSDDVDYKCQYTVAEVRAVELGTSLKRQTVEYIFLKEPDLATKLISCYIVYLDPSSNERD